MSVRRSRSLISDRDDSSCQLKMSAVSGFGANVRQSINNIKVRSINLEDHDRVLAFLRENYYVEEPLTVGREPKQQDPEDEEFNMSQVTHGTCLMALEPSIVENGTTERVVGVVLAGPKERYEADHLFEEAERFGPTKWGQILQFLACVERDANVYSRYDVEKALHAHVLSVDKRLRGRSIGSKLIQELKVLGCNLNYPLLTMDCTSLYSAQLCERLGMDCVHTVRYDQYVDEKGVQVFTPPQPHECIKTYAVRLNHL